MNITYDACVLKAAGTTDHPVSITARESLFAALTMRHQTTVCPTLFAEWKKHKSGLAQKWIASMFARKLIVLIPNYSGHATSIDAHLDLLPSEIAMIAKKDAHLLKIAIAHGQQICSFEKKCRTAFSTTAAAYTPLHQISWLDGVSDARVVSYLKGETAHSSDWFL